MKARGKYTDNWKAGLVQAEVRARAGHCCEQCGMTFKKGTNLAIDETRYDGRAMVGTCHHIDGNRGNDRMDNLVYLCQRCHIIVHRHGWGPGEIIPLEWIGNMPKWIIERGIPYQDHPQVALFEVE